MLLVGHRGAPAYEPENTIRSLKKAFELGANGVEFDIRQTKDGQIVLMHDSRLL
ncbi:glycerophosphodiester phosphodiesterase, partial [Candidatus Peregrinibacteria bacterium]|nr:glycerophosphodiester phosphodiesterase [Candidatus Peregrinibacteria bacterium]